ncbi:hypothetical protein [Marilutibacter aestuarii]|uniref:Thioredoxin-like fold domain-containing protein n=1 Tax=Marilutibacter aestuarii TaxID=1706195 RepID=A0A508AJ14_9GAMM|nr:hypothetical protein [Lysobacter aestuarii]TQD45682.1 hypothetical protein FKV25_07585 [Lysobacter aestuarii]
MSWIRARAPFHPADNPGLSDEAGNESPAHCGRASKGACRRIAHLLAFLLLAPVLLAQAQVRSYRELPEAAWETLQAAPGIRWSGAQGMKASVQVVCDANCPYCARLDRTLRARHPDLAVRWVPTAYFKPDSEAMAAALLSAPDPSAALAANYRDYDFGKNHGGYAPPPAAKRLVDGHAALKAAWKQWGGFTPMVIVRTRDGRVLQAMGSGDRFLESVLAQAAPPARVYEAWNETP